MWLFAGPLVAIIIRKPGAAFFGETIAAVIETLLAIHSAWRTHC